MDQGRFCESQAFRREVSWIAERPRPGKSPTKKSVTIRLDQNVVEFFKKDGDGWQGRIDKTFVDAVQKASRKKKGSAR